MKKKVYAEAETETLAQELELLQQKKKEIINWHIQLKVKILTWKVNTLFVTVKQSNKCTVKNDISG